MIREEVANRIGCMPQLVATMIIVGLFFLSSCATRKSIEYVDREVVKYKKELVHDTLIQHTHDSVYHTIFQKGDTIYDTKYVEKTKWRDRVVYKTDTCYRDSVYTQTKEKTVEKQKIPKWYYFSLVVCVLFIIFAIVKLVRWMLTL